MQSRHTDTPEYCTCHNILSYSQKIIERFHRNQSKKPNEDIAERIFLPNDNKLKVLYHLEDNRITPSTREFTYPHLSGDQGYILTYNSDMVTSYQVDPYAKSSKDRCLFEQLESLIKAQDDSIASVRASEQEVCVYMATLVLKE